MCVVADMNCSGVSVSVIGDARLRGGDGGAFELDDPYPGVLLVGIGAVDAVPQGHEGYYRRAYPALQFVVVVEGFGGSVAGYRSEGTDAFGDGVGVADVEQALGADVGDLEVVTGVFFGHEASQALVPMRHSGSGFVHGYAHGFRWLLEIQALALVVGFYELPLSFAGFGGACFLPVAPQVVFFAHPQTIARLPVGARYAAAVGIEFDGFFVPVQMVGFFDEFLRGAEPRNPVAFSILTDAMGLEVGIGRHAGIFKQAAGLFLVPLQNCPMHRSGE